MYWFTGTICIIAMVCWIVVLSINVDVVHYNIMLSFYYGLVSVGLITTTVLLNLKMRLIEGQDSARKQFLIYQVVLCILATLNFIWVTSIPDLKKGLSFDATVFLIWVNLVFELPILLVVCFSHKSTFSVQDEARNRLETNATLLSEDQLSGHESL